MTTIDLIPYNRSGCYGFFNKQFYSEKIISLLDNAEEIRKDKRISIVKKRSDRAIMIYTPAENGVFHIKMDDFRERSNLRILYKIFLKIFNPSRAKSSWDASMRLISKGFQVPLPVAYIEKRRCRILSMDLFVTEYLSDTMDLCKFYTTYLADTGNISRYKERIRVIKEIANIISRLHNEGIFYYDLKANNLRIARDDSGNIRFYFTDLESVRFKKVLSISERAHDLACINSSLYEIASFSAKMRFLQEYIKDNEEIKKVKDILIKKIEIKSVYRLKQKGRR